MKAKRGNKGLYSARTSVPLNSMVNPSPLIFNSDEDIPLKCGTSLEVLEAGRLCSAQSVVSRLLLQCCIRTISFRRSKRRLACV